MFLSKPVSPVLKVFGLSILFLLSACSSNVNHKKKSNKDLHNIDSLSTIAENLFQKGKIFSKDSANYNEATKLYRQSLKIFAQLEDDEKVARSYKRIGIDFDYLEEYDSAIIYLQLALKLNTLVDNKKENAIICNFLGIEHCILGNLDSSFYYFNHGIELTEITRDTAEFIDLYQNLGIYYSYTTEYQKAIESLIKAWKYSEALQDTSAVFSQLINIGQLFYEMEDFHQANVYLSKALAFAPYVDNPYPRASLFDTYGSVLLEAQNYDSAQIYYSKTLFEGKRAKSKRCMAAAYRNLADIYIETGFLEKAEENINQSLWLEKEIGNVDGEISSMLIISSLKKEQKKYSIAIQILDTALLLSNKNQMPYYNHAIYHAYYQTYKAKGKFKKALQYFEMYKEEKDSISNVKVKEKIADLEIKYETEKKQHQIELLNEENKTKQQQIKARNRFIISLVFLVLFIVSLLVILRQRSNQKLDRMESDLQKYLLKIKDMEIRQKKSESEISSDAFAKKYDLTERETEVLNLIHQGKSNAEIGEAIFVSSNTIKYHIKNIYLKLDVKNRVEALNKVRA